MEKVKSFFNGLQRSTVITLISCVCFVLMTFVILMFFMLFPITPSERVADRLGRESVFRSNGENNAVVAEPATSDEQPMVAYEQTVTTTAPRQPTAHTSYTITITSGSGFLYNGVIPTGVYPYEEITTTVAAEPYEGTTDDPSLLDPTDDPSLIDPTDDPSLIDPTDDPSLIEPTEPAVVEPDPPVVTTPPADDPPSGGSEVSEW